MGVGHVPGGFDQAFISEVRARNDIVSVVGDYVTLRKAGTSWKGLCPFHGEKSPSFHVHPDRQYFYCFGCQTGGDIIKFVSELNGFSFVETLRHLANRAGVAVPEPTRDAWRGGSGGEREKRPAKEASDAFFEVNRLANRFYVETLAAEAGVRCRAYLARRGVTPETAARFELGCAPDRWDGLTTYLTREGADLRAAETLGLIVRREGRSGHYDRFRNRLMFPIHSLAGEVLGFSGRDLGDSALLTATSGDAPAQTPAKYVNSPESPIYTKGDQLYGLFQARQTLRVRQAAILVEGNLDLVRLHQEGFAHAVAPLGTALTGAQLRRLKRLVPRVTALYDGDGAGREAAKKAVHLALAEGVLVDVATLPQGSDPDAFVGEHGGPALEALLGRALPGFEHLVEQSLSATGGGHSAQGARAAIEQLAPVLRDITDNAARAVFEGKLATVLGVPVSLVRDVVRAGPRPAQADRAAFVAPAAPAVPATPMPPRELKLLELLVLAPEVRDVFIGRDAIADVTHPDVRAAIEAVLEADPTDPGGLMANLPEGPARLWLFGRLPDAAPPARGQTLPELDLQLRGLRAEALARRVGALRLDEKRASLISDETRAITLLRERLQLERQLEELRAARG
jgi:DNA primase